MLYPFITSIILEFLKMWKGRKCMYLPCKGNKAAETKTMLKNVKYNNESLHGDYNRKHHKQKKLTGTYNSYMFYALLCIVYHYQNYALYLIIRMYNTCWCNYRLYYTQNVLCTYVLCKIMMSLSQNDIWYSMVAKTCTCSSEDDNEVLTR